MMFGVYSRSETVWKIPLGQMRSVNLIRRQDACFPSNVPGTCRRIGWRGLHKVGESARADVLRKVGNREEVVEDTGRGCRVVVEEQQGHAGPSKEEVVRRQDRCFGVCDGLRELNCRVVDGLKLVRRDGNQTALREEGRARIRV